MKYLSKSEKEAAYRIFNHIDKLCKGYHGYKTLEEAKEFASSNHWLMYPDSGVDSLRTGAETPLPNIFLNFDDEEITDNGHGQIEGSVGVTFGNTDSLARFMHVLDRKPDSIMSPINRIGEKWEVWVSQKIKTQCKDNTPVYRFIPPSYDSDTVTADDIKKAISSSNSNLIQKGTFYENEEVFWCVTVLGIQISTSFARFDKDVLKAFKLFLGLLSKVDKNFDRSLATRLGVKYNHRVKSVPGKSKKHLTSIERLQQRLGSSL